MTRDLATALAVVRARLAVERAVERHISDRTLAFAYALHSHRAGFYAAGPAADAANAGAAPLAGLAARGLL